MGKWIVSILAAVLLFGLTMAFIAPLRDAAFTVNGMTFHYYGLVFLGMIGSCRYLVGKG